MATANPTADGELEEYEEYREQREILSQRFSEVRQRLDERELELSSQLEKLFRENLKKRRIINSDIQQLINAMEQLKSTLISNTLCETEIEAIDLFQEKIAKLKTEKRLKLSWSPQKLFHEIENIGDFSLIPALDKVGIPENIEILNESIIPSYDQQKTDMHPLLSFPFQNGQSWYLIHIRWFKQWKRYVGYDNSDRSDAGDVTVKPGPIDNTPLLENGKLKRKQADEVDYKLVPEEAWNKLVSWYGSVEGSEIRRYVIGFGKFVKRCKVEVYLLELKACVYPRENDFKSVTLSRCDTIQTLVRKIREVYNISNDKQTRIYYRYMTPTYEEIRDLSEQAQDVGLFDGQCVMLEIQNVNGSWPRTAKLFPIKNNEELLVK